MNHEFFHATRSMSDAEFEHAVAQIRTARQAAREAIAVERAWHTATDGASARYAAAAARTGTDRLQRELQLAGFTAAEARRRVEATR